MSARCTIVSFVAVSTAALVCGCNPYERRNGEYQAGSVNPAQFPKEYLGTGGKGNMPGSGYFAPLAAKAGGKDAPYYYFPLSAAQAGLSDPLLLDPTGVVPALGYHFDPGQKVACAAPPGYVYQPQSDAVRYDQQGAILTDLPDDTAAYVPLVQEVAVVSAGEPCQDIKSEATLLTRTDVHVPQNPPPTDLPDATPSGQPDGKILAWAIIDPAAKVLGINDSPDDMSLSGLGLQSWAWYNHYLAAYLDGGQVPTVTAMGKTHLLAQKLYFPDTVLDSTGMPAPGTRGLGFNVIEAARGGAGYSPLCEVWSYTPVNPSAPVTDVKDVPMGATDTHELIYCYQLAAQ